jgi:filamentous hemagglutinin family protein
MYRTGQRLTSTTQLTAALLASTALGGVAPALAGELPTGGSVAYGTVGISTPRPNAMAIQQSSGTAIVNWQGFSIGRDARVDIAQPSATSTLLNRVTGATPSTIAGKLNANGQVYLVNPNGIAITKTGTVKASAFVASTLAISDDDFKAGKRGFTGNGRSTAVTNRGAVEIGPGGYAALIGGRVENAGTVSVPLGKVGLGAGEQATLDLSGDGFLQVAVPSAGSAPGALIRHTGRIRADGGRVEITAATAREAARHAVNLKGVVEAKSVGGRSGAIVLGGGSGGRVAVSGQLAARGEKGGAITVTGRDIRLKGATLDASGAAGGGVVQVGGAYQGKGSLQRAATMSLDGRTRIRADATGRGDGGEVVVWSEEKTAFRGRISARGGPDGGDGGDAEVSGKALLDYRGQVTLSAPKGSMGALLLDPTDVAINATGAEVSTGTNSPISAIAAGSLQAALSSANVTINTAAPGEDAGNISVNVPVTWTSGSTLTLQANSNIVINQNITATAGGLTLLAGGTITTPDPPGGAINVGTFILQGGAWTQNSTQLPAFAAGDFRITTGSFLRVAGGDGGGGGDQFQIVDVYGLQGIGSTGVLRASQYQLAANIDASGTANWNGGVGFVPIGGGETPFTGNFDGQGGTISGLTINRPGLGDVGLFGRTGEGSAVANIVLTNANIAGGTNVGGLVGANFGIITNARATATVSGAGATANIGGLVGFNCDCGTITGSSASGTVTSTATAPGAESFPFVGGLVGSNEGGIIESFATGAVSALTTAAIGGLVGSNTASPTNAINRSFATGPVTGAGPDSAIGGLVGDNSGTIFQSHASGRISGTGPGSAVGGLVGFNEGSLDETYATGFVTAAGAGSDVGGLVGLAGIEPSIANSYWDISTTGQSTSAGGIGLTTAQLQSALPDGFDADFWGILPGQSYPFLLWRFPAGPLVMSGFVNTAPGSGVSLLAGGTLRDATNAGANSYYYFATDPLAAGQPLGATAFLSDPGALGSATRDVTVGQGAIANANITSGRASILTNQPTSSGLLGLLAPAVGTTLPPSLTYTFAPGLGVTFKPGVDVAINATNVGGFTVNQSVVANSDLLLTSAGPLTIGAGQTIRSIGGDVTVSVPRFVNNGGATGIQAGGRFLVYSQDWEQDVRGGLQGENLYNRTFAANPPGTITQSGDRFIFARQPVLTFRFANGTRRYGSLASLDGAVTPSGLVNGDTLAEAFSGAPTVTDTTSARTDVGTYPGAVLLSRGSLLSDIGYAFTFSPSPLTITPAPLTIVANNQLKPVGTEFVFTGTEFTALGLVQGDQVASASLASAGAPSTAFFGFYPILVGDADGTGLGNYDITFVPGTLLVGLNPEISGVATDGTNLSANLPITTPVGWNPADEIVIEGGGSGGGPTLGTGLGRSNRAAAAAALAFVERASADLERRVAECERRLDRREIGPRDYAACVADALEQYANTLESRILELPPPFRGVAATIRQAARQVRVARTVTAARAAVRTAVAEIRKAIALVRADEPEVARIQVRQGNAIASALQSVETKLAKAVGL